MVCGVSGIGRGNGGGNSCVTARVSETTSGEFTSVGIRSAGMSAIAIAADALVALLVPGGDTSMTAGLIVIVLLAIPAAIWGNRDAKAEDRVWRWSVGKTWALVTLGVVIICSIASQVAGTGDVAAAVVGIAVAALIGVFVPALVGAHFADPDR